MDNERRRGRRGRRGRRERDREREGKGREERDTQSKLEVTTSQESLHRRTDKRITTSITSYSSPASLLSPSLPSPSLALSSTYYTKIGEFDEHAWPCDPQT